MKAPISLTARERQALVLLVRFRFLTMRQLQAWLFFNSQTKPLSQDIMTRRVLTHLAKLGLASRTTRPVGGNAGGSGPHIYFATSAGVRESGLFANSELPRRSQPRGGFLIAHSLMAADVALAFAKAAHTAPGHAVAAYECDWEVAQRFGRQLVVPDAFMVYQTPHVELTAFVEVDLGTVGLKGWSNKIARYLELYRSGAWRQYFELWPVVLVVTPTKQRAERLQRTTATLLKAQRDQGHLERATEFSFADIDAVAAGPLGRTWITATRTGMRALLDGSDS